MSPPVRGRGLKRCKGLGIKRGTRVAPRAGAWIETYYPIKLPPELTVAPRAGAWIETML